MSMDTVRNVVVIGAGVIGLTTALKIQEKGGYKVTVIAETFPSDPKSVRYTSPWAVRAHHVSHAAADVQQRKIDEETFKVMWDLSAPGGDAEGCFLRIKEKEWFYDGRNTHLDWMPDFQQLPEDPLLPNARIVSFTTFTIDTPAYLNYLLSRFLARGGNVVRSTVQHISQIVEGGAQVFARGRASPTPVDALVVCPGLGARTLGGVEDKNVFPIRGQLVVLRAPWVNFGRTASHEKQGVWTYIVPRRSGDVIIGGTKVDNDWYPVARPETTQDILTRCLALCPELAPAHVRAERAPTVEDLYPLIQEEGCGFRPARAGGIRLGVEWVDTPGKKGKIPVVFNYGHGGGGYQSSWGSASVALDLLEKALVGEQ